MGCSPCYQWQSKKLIEHEPGYYIMNLITLRTRWIKVLLDLWSNRGRTLIVALAIAVGVYSVGVIIDVQQLLLREYGNDQSGALISTATIYTTLFDDDLAGRIAQLPGVVGAEGRNTVRVYVYDGQGERKDLLITTVPNLEDMNVDKITPLAGSWPPQSGEITLERLALDYLDVNIGEPLIMELEDGAKKQLTIAGTAHDPQEFSPEIFKSTSGYVLPQTMDKMGFGALYPQMRLRLAPEIEEKSEIDSIIEKVEDQIERSGHPVFMSTITVDGRQNAIIDTVILMLSAFAIIILLLSGFLVINAISALITQQVQQIGIMKLIGAGRLQISAMYIVTVLVYGLIAIVIGIPLAIVTAQMLMTDIVEPLLNVNSEGLMVSFSLILTQIGIGLLLPLLAGVIPVLNGTRITTRKALNDSGMKANIKGKGLIERLLAAVQVIRPLRRPVLLSVRNTMRHKGRLAQTLFVLIIGTALFISVLSVNASVDATLASFMRHHQYDVSIAMARPYRSDRLERSAEQIPGIAAVESWSIAGATRLREDNSESDPFRVYAVPAATKLVDPQMDQGQWLDHDLTNGIVVNSDVLDKEADLAVGDSIRLDVNGREMIGWVTGIIRTDSQGPAVYMDLDDYSYLTRTPGQTTHLQVIATDRDPVAQNALKGELLRQLEEAGFEVSGAQTAQQINNSNELMFTIIVAFLILMALLLAAVGGLGLTTTMSINMLERIREIGVLRAIGASTMSVRQIVLAEGLVIGVLSWLLGVLISIPVSAFLSDQVGLALLKVPLNYQYSLLAAVVWFFALLLIAAAASLGPARNAARLTIREVLAYE